MSSHGATHRSSVHSSHFTSHSSHSSGHSVAHGGHGYSGHLTAGRRYTASQWGHYHPGWRGHYYYHGGHYFYDPFFAYPAVVVNDWSGIAVGFGGVALLGAFNNDPFLTFVGAAGALYAYSRYEHDLHSGSRYDRLRATYFSRPYFWRNGVRYDRVVVYEHGTRYYRFRRHAY